MGIGELLSRIVDDAKLAFDPRNMVAGAQYALDDPVGFGQDFFKGYAELIRHPIRNFSEHPLLSAMAVAPVVPPAVRLSKLMSNPGTPDPMDLPGDLLGPAQRGPFGPQEGPFRIGQKTFDEDGFEFSPPEKPFQMPKGTFSIKGEGDMDIGYGLPNSRFEELLRSARNQESHGDVLADAMEDLDWWDSAGPHNDPLNDVMDGLFDVHRNPERLFSKRPLPAPEGRGPSGEYRALNEDRYGSMPPEQIHFLMNHGYDMDEIRRMTPDEIEEATARANGMLGPEDIPDDLFEDVYGEVPLDDSPWAGMDADQVELDAWKDSLAEHFSDAHTGDYPLQRGFVDPDVAVNDELADLMAQFHIGAQQDRPVAPNVLQDILGDGAPDYTPQPRYRMFEEVNMMPGMNDNPMFAASERQHLMEILARLRAQRGF